MKRQHGFTMVELILVIVLIGVLAAVGIPRLMGEDFTKAVVFGDQVASTLRQAQKTAVARRRLVCVETTATTLRLRIRTSPVRPLATDGAAACNAALAGVSDGDWDSADARVTMANAPATLFFHPDGTIGGTPLGAPFGARTIEIRMNDQTRRNIVFDGRTGYVE